MLRISSPVSCIFGGDRPFISGWFQRFAPLAKEERGVSNLLVTILLLPLLLFLVFAIVPVFVYSIKGAHMNTAVSHALKEAEAVGYVSPEIASRLNDRLAALGMGGVTVNGTGYPSYAGSTESKVLRDDADPTVKLAVKYPAPNLSRMLRAIGGQGSAQKAEGFYYIVLYGRSEAYE
ncbi:hypothetical protein ACP26L_05015 [Paenibacillus sp. S-38]|uniref:hypothetical protein n=1 Tax=Paenibacillus sp. S-38 TaxID=3416710 RepID=UPI003CEB241E